MSSIINSVTLIILLFSKNFKNITKPFSLLYSNQQLAPFSPIYEVIVVNKSSAGQTQILNESSSFDYDTAVLHCTVISFMDLLFASKSIN